MTHIQMCSNSFIFPGLVQVAAESECGASLHEHRKCSQALLVNGSPGESALEGGYTYESASPQKQRGTRAIFTLTCNPAFMLRFSFTMAPTASNCLWCHYWVCLTGSRRVCYRTNAVHEPRNPLVRSL